MWIEVVGQFLLAHDAGAFAHQVFQYAVLKGREVQARISKACDLGREVNRQRAQRERIGGRLERAPEQRLHARRQLGVFKRLDQVVVRARLQALHLVLPAAAGGQDQDRQGTALGTQRLHHRQAVHFGQTQVHNGQVDRIFAGLKQAILAVARLIDAVAVGFELALQAPAQHRVILDQQQAHGVPRLKGV